MAIAEPLGPQDEQVGLSKPFPRYWCTRDCDYRRTTENRDFDRNSYRHSNCNRHGDRDYG